MKSLRNDTKIFKYYEFLGDESIKPGTEAPIITEAPYLAFGDEDYHFRKRAPGTGAKANESKIDGDNLKPIIEGYKKDLSVSMAEKIINGAEQEAKDIIEKSRKDAQKIIDKANKDAEKILAEEELKCQKILEQTKEEAYRTAYEQGISDGHNDGIKQALQLSEDKTKAFFAAIDEACGSIEAQREEILQQNLQDLTKLTLAISEKVIRVALDTCGEVVKRMILSAAAPASEKQWAKITISAKDMELMRDEGIDLKQELCSVSDKIDLIILDDAKSGTCLIEFPDQAIDAGADTQLENIKTEILEAGKD